MAIRVTQKTMYNDMVGQMQKNLAGYMESVQQGSTQKKINRPSDDPAGTYRVLTTRIDLTNTAQYQENVDTAKGWLNLEDSVLSTRVPAELATAFLPNFFIYAKPPTPVAGYMRIRFPLTIRQP